MTALMKLLCDTLPIAAVECSLAAEGSSATGANQSSMKGECFRSSPRSSLLRYMTYLDPKDGADAFFEGWDTIDPSRTWSIGKQTLQNPASVVDVRCRTNGGPDAGNIVFNRVAFGRESGVGFDPTVQVTLTGIQLQLPLTSEFLWAQWLISGAELAEGFHPLWLETQVDLALLRVFVFDVDLDSTKKLSPLNDNSILCSAPDVVFGHEVQFEYRNISREYGNDTAEFNLVKDIDFFPFEAPNVPVGQVGESTHVKLQPTRIIVVCVLTLCKSSNNFDPHGAATTSRFYPHIMVMGTTNIEEVDAAVLIERPDGSSSINSEEKFNTMDALLVAHSNKAAIKYDSSPPVPCWDNVFNYYQAGSAPFIGRKLTVVDRNLVGVRSSSKGWVERRLRYETNLAADQTPENVYGYDSATAAEKQYARDVGKNIVKLTAQGAFDGVSFSPLASLTATDAKWSWSLAPMGYLGHIDASWKLGAISQGPLLGADSLYIGWRWSDTSVRRETWGWDEQLPYQVIGAPMVPTSQDVAIRLLSRSTIVYIAGNGPVFALKWCIVMHHGGAYSVDDSALRAFLCASFLELVAGALTLTGVPPVASDSSFLSWRCRFSTIPVGNLTGTINPQERTLMLDLEKAMKL